MDILSIATEAINRGSSIIVNWTDEDFIGKWDGKEYTLRAGRTVKVELGDASYNAHVASHFAKNIAERELHKSGLTVDHHTKQELIDKCFVKDVPEAETKEPVEKTETAPETGKEDKNTPKPEAPRRGRPATPKPE